MTYFQAIKILDEVKDGVDHPEQLINEALLLTGDVKNVYVS